MHIQRFCTAFLCLLGGLTAVFNWAEHLVLDSFDDLEFQFAFYVSGLFGLPFFLALQYKWKRNIPRTHTIVISISLLLALSIGFDFIDSFDKKSTSDFTFFRTALKLGNGVLVEMFLALLSLITVWLLRYSKRVIEITRFS